MAKPYPIVPLSFLDELHGLNLTLEAYHKLVLAWVDEALNQGVHGDPKTFVVGLDNLFRPILEGYQGIESQCSTARKMGMVGIASLDPDQGETE